MSHEPLIKYLTLFYQTLANLCHIEHTDIIYPPIPINLSAAEEAGLSPSAISLLQILPQLSRNVYSLSLIPGSTQSVCYLDNDLSWSRTPTYQEQPEIPTSAFVLTNPNVYGLSLIYDTTSHKLLAWDAWGKHVDYEISEIENPFAMLQDAKPADEILRPWMQKLLTLEWVPFGSEIVEEPDVEHVRAAAGNADLVAQYQLRFVQWSLREIYTSAGWDAEAEDPETASKGFDANCFAQMKAEWMERTQKVLDRAYADQWSWKRIRMEMGNELASNDNAKLLDEAWPAGQQMRRIEM